MKDNESKSDFTEQAKLMFAFLTEHSFSCITISSFKIRYESKKAYIEIAYGERDGEVSISFGRIGRNEDYSFTLFLRLVNPELDEQLGNRLAYNPSQICECLKKLAYALKSEGLPIINGDDAVFERMKSVRWWDFRPEALQ